MQIPTDANSIQASEPPGTTGEGRDAPTIEALRSRAEAIRSQEVERMLRKRRVEGALREHLEALSLTLVDEVLRAPLARLRSQAVSRESVDIARSLFGLADIPRAKKHGPARGRERAAVRS